VPVNLVEAIVEFPGDQQVQTLMRKRFFLAFTKTARLTLSAINYRRSRHSIWPDMRVFWLATSWGMRPWTTARINIDF